MIFVLKLIFGVVFVSFTAYSYPKPLVSTFDNGLTLVTVNDPNATVASSYVFIRTGSLFEGKRMGAGLSHYLEHLVAGGTTQKKSEDAYRKIIDSLGGVSNAYTTYDHTAYYIKSSSENAGKALQVLYEWMAHADWTNEEYKREKGVVLKEMERAKSNVHREIYQHTQSLFYKDSPYRFPVIGYKDVFLNTTSEDLKAYYQSSYVPENMVVVVGGNISENAMVKSVEDTFGQLPKKAAKIRYQANQLRLISTADSWVVMKSIKTQRIVMRYPIVSFYHNDVYPLDLLAYIFGNGEQSLLYQEFVVKRKMATSIHVSSITPAYDTGYFEIIIESNHNQKVVIQDVQEFIDQFKWRRLKTKALSKAVSQKRTEYILGKSSLDQYLKEIGQAMMMGQNPLFFEVYSKGFSGVRSGDINRVVHQYLGEKHRQSYVFKDHPNQREVSHSIVKNAPLVEAVIPGVNLMKVKESNDDIVQVTVQLDGGINEESRAENGIGYLSASLIGKKIRGMDRKDFQDAFEKKGASIGATLSHNSLTYSITTTTKDAPHLLPLFMKGLTQFDVDLNTFNEVKEKIIKSITKKNEEWFEEAFDQIKAGINRPESIFSLPLKGTAESVKSLSLDMVNDYINKRLATSSMVIVVQSSDPDKIGDIVKNECRAISKKEPIKRPAPVFNDTYDHAFQLTQPVGVVMRIDPIKTNKKTLNDYVRMQLVDALLSGMRYPSGLLHKRLRGNQLVYVVHTLHMRWEDQDMLFTYALTDGSNVETVTTVIDEAFNEIKTTVSNAQFDLAKSQVLFNFQNTRQNMKSKVSDMMYHYQTFGRITTERDIKKELNKIQIEDVINYATDFLGASYTFKFNG